MLSVVLKFLDLHTLSTLCLVNRWTKAVVKGFIPFKLIDTHVPSILNVPTWTEVASHFTAIQVFNTLCSNLCAIWGKFGAFLWVPDCIWCCIPCIWASDKLMPMTTWDEMAAFGLSKKTLSKIPIVHTLPGIYTLTQVPYQWRQWLLSQGRACEIAIKVHGGEEGLISYINFNTLQGKTAYDQCVAKLNATRSSFEGDEISTMFDNISWFLVATRPLILTPDYTQHRPAFYAKDVRLH